MWIRKSMSDRRARVVHDRLNFPNKGWSYFVSGLERNGKTKRDTESLLWAKKMFTNPPATTKSINLYILLWLIRVTRATNSCWLLEVFVERLGVFFCLFFFFFLFLDFISLYEEGVYLRRNENHTELYLAKAEGFYRIAFVRVKVLT